MKRFLAAALLILVLAGCGKTPSGSPEDENKIRIAVFEYEIQQHPAAVYFLSVGQPAEDPNAEVMGHFDGRTPPVKPVSQGTIGADGALTDSTSGETGVLLRAGAIEWSSKTEADVKGGHMAGMKSASNNTYHVVLKDGEWAVDTDTVDSKT